jgi:hypothetical protein
MIEMDKKILSPWQIEAKMLHVDYNTMLGKGANAVVYQGTISEFDEK